MITRLLDLFPPVVTITVPSGHVYGHIILGWEWWRQSSIFCCHSGTRTPLAETLPHVYQRHLPENSVYKLMFIFILCLNSNCKRFQEWDMCIYLYQDSNICILEYNVTHRYITFVRCLEHAIISDSLTHDAPSVYNNLVLLCTLSYVRKQVVMCMLASHSIRVYRYIFKIYRHIQNNTLFV